MRDMDITDEYEAFAEWFYRVHGYMAPGKDQPAAMGGRPRDLSERWYAFRGLLGPSDEACIKGLYLLWEDR